MVSPLIFRQYDIRGVVGPDLNAETAFLIGCAFGTLVRREFPSLSRWSVALGRDNRLTSDELAESVRNGLLSTGVHVLDIGTVPTPVLSYAVHHLGTEAGLQVTGSHNPAQYNGFKMTLGGRSIYGGMIQELRRMIEEDDIMRGVAYAEFVNVLPDYVDMVASKVHVGRPLKVVVDCGNGTGSVVVNELFAALGSRVEMVPLFCDSDGSFPNHHPDPVVDKNLAHLIEKVKEVGADFGVAFDGDADRIGAVDEHGAIVRGDILLLLYALDLLERLPGHPIVFDVKCTQALVDVLAQAGGRPVMAKTGHSLIKKKMKEEGSLLAGELSGHIMFGENYYGFDDALYAAALLVSILSRSSESLSEKTAKFPRYISSPEMRYDMAEEDKAPVMEALLAHFRSSPDVRGLIEVDGVRAVFEGGWGLLRASNTEPVLVGRFEADSAARLAEIERRMEEALELVQSARVDSLR